MAYCSDCGRKIPENGSFCPNCGTSSVPPAPKKARGISKKMLIWTVVGALLLGIGTALIIDLTEDDEINLFGLFEDDTNTGSSRKRSSKKKETTPTEYTGHYPEGWNEFEYEHCTIRLPSQYKETSSYGGEYQDGQRTHISILFQDFDSFCDRYGLEKRQDRTFIMPLLLEHTKETDPDAELVITEDQNYILVWRGNGVLQSAAIYISDDHIWMFLLRTVSDWEDIQDEWLDILYYASFRRV